MNFVLALVCLFGLTSAFEDKTVVQYLVDNPEYSTLAGLVTSADLVTALSGSGPFTIFAPTNAAFNKIDAATLQTLASNKAQLANVLKYHVVNEFVLVPMISQVTNKTTLEGQDLSVAPGGGSMVVNGVSKVDSTTSNNDIIVNNGVIQPIDTVLFPPNQASLNIAQILLKDDARFKDVFLALLLANLTSVLETGDYTMFAPVDSAFAEYKDNLLSPNAPNAQAVYQEVLKYHVVPGARRANSLSTGSLFTLHGTSVAVSVGSVVRVNTANVIDTDIMATNGVIHAIDKLLIPQDINQIVQG